MSAKPQSAANGAIKQYDAIIIGAGMSGMYQLHTLRKLGLSVRVLEAGTNVGGTWYWNRYPGARFDSESYSYAFSFSKEILAEWDWTEHFSPQPETLKYLNFVADKLDLRRDMDFKTRVKSAHYDDATKQWNVAAENGAHYRSRFLITAVGPLSAPTMPTIPGTDTFKGESYHTGLWPHHPVSFEGKRVAVIGTGATGVQTIQEVAKTVGHLTVFQRTPNWCKPLKNKKIEKHEQPALKARYPEIFKRCEETFSCFLHTPDPRHAVDVPPAEREAYLEKLYETPGFGMWQGNFADMLTNRESNAIVSEFVANKIRSRVKNQAVAEKLIPKNHGFGTRRVPMETNYYEVYNQPNVELVDIKETPIERITEKGIETSNRKFEFDMIIYATGFDAVTGSFDRIDIRGKHGLKLKDRWKGGPETFVGVAVDGFPNMFMLVGPHTALGNIPRSIEYNVEWVAGLIDHMMKHKQTFAEPSKAAVDHWTDFVREKAKGLLSNEIDSWMTGVNRNVAGKDKRILARYSGSAPAYREWCDNVAKTGYKEMSLA
ncbi:MAG: NAD(P)/FAD-dependent oxidoreductase [Proteobacteria bacterium]|nr:NAD(P)/FAD-dependent oxidoreductase [Pseudomonadota bacterium]